MRKKAPVDEKLEKLAVADARHAVDFAEVVVLLLDATRGLEHQDLKIASMVLEEGRALIVAINKWDVAEIPQACSTASAPRSTTALASAGRAGADVSARTGKGLDTCSPPPSTCARRGLSRVRPRRSTAGSIPRSPPIRRRRPAASGSSCATSPRLKPALPASFCSAPGSTCCPRATSAIW
jgi:hypothetical protein